jgi:hypothetical protein
MSRQSKYGGRSLEASDALPLDELHAMVGGAGAPKKTNLTAEQAAAMTAGGEAGATLAQAGPAKVDQAKDESGQVDKSFRGQAPAAIKFGAGISGGTEVTYSGKDGKVEFKKEAFATEYERRAEKALTAKDKAQTELQAAKRHEAAVLDEVMKNTQARVDFAAKGVEAAQKLHGKALADADRAQDRTSAAAGKVLAAGELVKATQTLAEADGHHDGAKGKGGAPAKDAAAKDRADALSGKIGKEARNDGSSDLGEARGRAKSVGADAASLANVQKAQQVVAAKADQALAKAKAQDGTARAAADTAQAKVKAATDVLDGFKTKLEPSDQKKLQAAQKAVEEARTKEADATAKAASLADRNNKAAIDKELKQKDRDAFKSMAREKGYGKVGGLAQDVLKASAMDTAKRAGTYHEKNHEQVLAGGVTTEVVKTADGQVTVKKIGQVTAEGKTKSYDSAAGVGREASFDLRAEAGELRTTETIDKATGKKTVVATKVYGSASFENSASVESTDLKKAVQVSSKVVVQGEVSKSWKTDAGEHKVYAEGRAEAGVKAGASIGFDGLKVSASASAEATAKAGWSAEGKIGDLAIKNDLQVFATARAEAKASAEVNFNPFSGEKVGAKVSVGAEAAAGVGIKDQVKLGDRVEVGGGLYAGKVGAKADVDVGYKNGKLSLDVDVGASLGVGVSVKFKADADFAGTAAKAKQEIANGDFGTKVKGVLSFVPTAFVIRSLFG